MRKSSFDHRVHQVIEENKRNAIGSVIMFTVYSIMIFRYQDDMWAVYDEYPQIVDYLISATAIYGFELAW